MAASNALPEAFWLDLISKRAWNEIKELAQVGCSLRGRLRKGYWKDLLTKGDADTILELLALGFEFPLNVKFGIPPSISLSHWKSDDLKHVGPVPQKTFGGHNIDPPTFSLFLIDDATPMPVIEAFCDVFAKQFPRILYDSLESHSILDGRYWWFAQMISLARKNFEKGKEEFSGYKDPRYALVRSYGPLGNLEDPKEVVDFITKNAKRDFRLNLDLMDPIILATGDLLLRKETFECENCFWLEWIEVRKQCSIC